MIDTSLHNQLIDKEITRKLVDADRGIQKSKNALMIDRVTYYVPVVLFLALVALLIIMLLRLISALAPSSSSSSNAQEYTQPATPRPSFEQANPNDTDPTTQDPNGQDPSTHDKTKKAPKLKEGIEYFKYDNHVYKRTWEKGIIINVERLEETIEESRKKLNEEIPQFAQPVTEEEPDVK